MESPAYPERPRAQNSDRQNQARKKETSTEAVVVGAAWVRQMA